MRTLEGGIAILSLFGSWYSMGRQYGHLAKGELHRVVKGFIGEKIGGNPQKRGEIEGVANLLYSHYPPHFKEFFKGAEETSELTLMELKMANAVEYIANESGCSALAFWGEKSDGGVVYGRNYDYPGYRTLCNEIIVTVFHPEDAPNSAAIIGYAGEIYAVNAINDKGLFLELNNGMPSAGAEIDFTKPASTTRLLEIILSAQTIDDLDNFFKGENSFTSFIIGVADPTTARSYEWCRDGVKRGDSFKSSTLPKGSLVITNHYVNPEWNYPTPTDSASWESITRRSNLEKMVMGIDQKVDVPLMQKMIQTDISEGGAACDATVYQMVVVLGGEHLWLKIIGKSDWVKIPIMSYLLLK